ncbi:MAG: hypothetical protein KGZ83_00700 [Sulfuricella sp.]|nr:hypothetical protein [Sulfuricella sp.]
MRTTIDIEDDILAVAKEMARLQHVSAGQIVSRLMREALTGRQQADQTGNAAMRQVGGFRPFPARGALVTNDQINDLRDQEGV